jgi:5-formyltetrahydrofolate cyclo-ligase
MHGRDGSRGLLSLKTVDKASLRRRMRDLGALDAAEAERAAERLFEWMSARLPGTVAAYLAMEDEVPVEPLFARLPGWRWVLPRVEEDGSLTLRDREVPRERHRWGMEQPVDRGPAIPVHEVDLILVPGLAFDRSGRRLGRGKGYYDRLLAGRRRDCLAVGVTVASRLVELVPTEDHDLRVDLLVTDEGVIPENQSGETSPR